MRGDQRSRTTRVGVRRELVLLWGVAALALVLVAIGAVVASRSVARAQALSDATRMTQRLADLVVGPLLNESLEGNPHREDELNRAVENRMNDGYLTEVTVWSRDGTVVYADESDEIGKHVPAPPEVLDAIDRNQPSAAFETTPEVVEPGFDPNGPGFVEVYVPFHMSGRPTMAFEAYYDYARVQETASGLLKRIIPLVLIPLLLLQFIQIPIAVSLAGRVRRHEADRSSLLERILSISEKERMRIAGDLHDGPIQDLAGIGYALGAVAPSVPENRRALMADVQSTVHHAIESLRRLMVDLYPPDLNARQLPDTLVNLAVPLREQGIDVAARVEPVPGLDTDTVTTLYRVARESLANVAKHSKADQVTIQLGLDAQPVDDGARNVNLVITDNGVGLDPARLDRRKEGHLGIRLLRDRVDTLGGTLTYARGAEGGTVVSVVLPVGINGENGANGMNGINGAR